ncbi:hypothetical protein L3X38_045477 [Prunus dulcis]|uniref:Uncharacterized protein n=1 Tax=Prunus dulcis TaxID=3755 RepID=A0AAD4URH5_PRUDU|nr:hypothetical protein L3X38_045477 [Prunus dulcis]
MDFYFRRCSQYSAKEESLQGEKNENENPQTNNKSRVENLAEPSLEAHIPPPHSQEEVVCPPVPDSFEGLLPKSTAHPLEPVGEDEGPVAATTSC